MPVRNAADVIQYLAAAGLFHKWQEADQLILRRLGANAPSNPLVGLTWKLEAGPGISVIAAPLAHRLPCWGYVFEEAAAPAPQGLGASQGVLATQLAGAVRDSGAQPGPGSSSMRQPGRKVVLLGDTCNSAAILGECSV